MSSSSISVASCWNYVVDVGSFTSSSYIKTGYINRKNVISKPSDYEKGNKRNNNPLEQPSSGTGGDSQRGNSNDFLYQLI